MAERLGTISAFSLGDVADAIGSVVEKVSGSGGGAPVAPPVATPGKGQAGETLGEIVGTIAGGYFGGAPGAVVGGQTGGTLGDLGGDLVGDFLGAGGGIATTRPDEIVVSEAFLPPGLVGGAADGLVGSLLSLLQRVPLVQVVQALAGSSIGRQAAQAVCRQLGVLGGAPPIAACPFMAEELEKMDKDAYRALMQYKCGTPAPIGLNKRGEAVWIALALAASPVTFDQGSGQCRPCN